MHMAKISFVAALLFGLAAPADARQQCPQPVKTDLQDYYALAITWQPGFCQVKRKQECEFASLATYFTLHGLWPQGAEYCKQGMPGTDAQKEQWVRRICNGISRKKLPRVTLSAETLDDLQRLMPSINTAATGVSSSYLERHEYAKHGSCFGTSQEGYFRAAIDLTDAVNATDLRTRVEANAGKEGVTVRDVCRWVRDSLGDAAELAVEADFSDMRFNGQDRPFLTELRIWLKKDATGTLGLKPANFVTVPAGADTLGPLPADPLCDNDLDRPVYIDLPGMRQ